MRRTVRRLLVGAAVVVLVVSVLPAGRARVKAAFVLAHALGVDVPRPLAPEVSRERVEIGGVSGDMYFPGKPAPPIVLVPGAAPKGPDDARVVRLAFSLARAGRSVFVPELALARRDFVTSDIDAIVTATRALDGDQRTSGRAVLLGFSYGGSFALLAAADPRLEDRLELVATFGAYFDLVGVAQAVTTGSSLVGNREFEWDAHPDATKVFREVIVSLAPDEVRQPLRRALEGDVEEADLPAEARSIYEFATNSDPTRTFELASLLPDEMKALLERFSPASVAGRMDAPVVALHSTDDPVVPYGEGVRVEEGIDGARLVTVSLFRHVDPEGGRLGAIPDLVRSWRFTSWIIAAQE
ncbi:MAG TPA: alpha/beta hydrolase [Actinomycetota bacterium]|nr:alpha/beta hydrolase [Actinomycetota bacterium]